MVKNCTLAELLHIPAYNNQDCWHLWIAFKMRLLIFQISGSGIAMSWENLSNAKCLPTNDNIGNGMLQKHSFLTLWWHPAINFSEEVHGHCEMFQRCFALRCWIPMGKTFFRQLLPLVDLHMDSRSISL